jgi:type IV pilus assembly protein PilY1
MMVNGVLTVVSGIGFGAGPSNPIFIENIMQVSLDDGSTKTIETQGSSAEAGRMSWRELVN